ncbi:MAG: hypothetical protein J7647_04905 [Cyanobacteria bacterium SBLK]|nr:hypothetical protein [Cyanobacteria bacterium SBLK]
MDWKPTHEEGEWHCAVNEENCFRMEEQFKQQGLDLYLFPQYNLQEKPLPLNLGELLQLILMFLAIGSFSLVI